MLVDEENDKQNKTMKIHIIRDYRPMGGTTGYKIMGITVVYLFPSVCGSSHCAACFSQPSLQANTSALIDFNEVPFAS